MDYIIVGGDERFMHLARLLARRGKKVGVFGREAPPEALTVGAGALGEAENLVVNCPPRLAEDGMTAEELLAAASADARVFCCGPLHAGQDDPRLIDLWSDEALLLKNARLTAEGAIAAAMRAAGWAIADARCMVIGWGRVGKALTELLVALGARVTVASRSESGRNRAVERGAEAADTGALGEALPGRRLIFNTAPCMVLDGETLEHVDRDAMLIDLASPPYGIDLRAAWSKGLRAWREPGLPGRYCPESAAQALLEAIDRRGL